ncbi:B12-binding domain-containing radical SAM protein [Cytobacillus firmus]|uniref:B12-binding domain-containing radical SAM protein n=1 Tax=Cytobacillus firmus TaxID=1399 RepID=A0AA46P3H3_CYTFI|nr:MULTISPECIES: B12-binding domain-containing radical SAM protein [Bacillaceae]KML36361.1 Fe-S oxidoreductase [Cytobacillus firmus]MCC3645430.1 B12-binding domain-containing radical SAM protein [Cytobacillus oceanisediminis]MCS0651994.1 B12-binding domain-containing radical SAM protein [Cytobacillus firmus]MCU1804799.1 B12-binding domain-containing radical SAM protein [Cytobacillus firmus]USK40388.1 B12-binding domain-containing radical SAM protein [Cytobacillus firmus]
MKVIASTLNAKYIHTNIAIRYLKAYAQPDFDVELAEYTIKDPVMNIVTDLIRKKPDVIGFSCYIWNIEETIKVIKMIKKIDPSIHIVVGGPEVTYDVADWMNNIQEFDYIVIGEGEETFKQLLTELNSTMNMENVHGLAFRENGQVRINPQRNKLDLRDLPSPFRFEEDIPHLSKRVTYIETSRGCPFSCQFCLSSIEVGVRYFDREKIKDDIRYLMKNGAKTLKFVDRTFNISRSYALEMFQFLIDEHLPGTVFQFEITADIMRPEVIEFLNKEAPRGLFRFEIGVQSTNDYTNELVMRKQNFDKLCRTVTMVKDGGKIDQHLDLIAGLPEEDYDSFKRTFNDVFAMRPEELQLGFLKMLRGTGLRLRAEDHQYIYMDHSPYEILGNNVLSFDDIIRIKQVEDVLEKYWNDHRMDATVEYLVTKVFPTPFDFFQEFGSYWEQKGWSRIGHQLEDLFKRLFEFLQTKEIADLDIAEGLMKFDYISKQKYKPRKPWWQPSFEKSERSKLYQSLLENPNQLGESFLNLQLNEKEIYKHTLSERLSFDIERYINEGLIEKKDSVLLAYFDSSSEEVSIFSGPLQ